MIGLYELKYSLEALLTDPQRAKQIAEAARAPCAIIPMRIVHMNCSDVVGFPRPNAQL